MATLSVDGDVGKEQGGGVPCDVGGGIVGYGLEVLPESEHVAGHEHS